MDQVQIKTESQLSIKEPSPYAIVFHNNELTTMEGVILILETIFSYPYAVAIPLMIDIHSKDKAEVWEGPQDLAQELFNLSINFCHQAPEEFGLIHLRIELKAK